MPEMVIRLGAIDYAKTPGAGTIWMLDPRARALYERLGYVAYGSKPDSWDQEAADGTVTCYETMLALMRKELARPRLQVRPTSR